MKKVILVFALVLMVASSAWAAGGKDCPLWDWTQEIRQSDNYFTRATGMVTDGVYRLVKAPFKLVYHSFKNMANDEYHALNPIGVLEGVGRATLKTADQIVVAGVNIVGSVIPGAHGIDTLAPSDTK